MTLAPLVSVADLAAQVREEIDTGDQRAALLIRSASALVRSETGRTFVTDGMLDVPDDVVGVVLQVAGRAWTASSPGLVEWSRGPFRDRVVDAVALGMFFTDQERRTLGRYNATRRGIYTVGTTRNDYLDDTVYVPTAPAPSGYPFPFLTTDDL